ncbi:MAG: hypothetical protein A3F09_01810 [Chlamydiae bacterium RIFCSPHIGHO2_12_FULL_49_11]|nr:MAG: hypothetical protein A3F09_01810 [Chlamydiae bacterium RIFCSPHIGHO2_12_FULL_49_11]
MDRFEDIDIKELDFPDTVFVRDIESRVFQSIVMKCLSSIEGVSLIEGTFFDHFLGREAVDRVKGVYVEQDSKNHSVSIKVELNVVYGISLPAKSEEIQTKIVKDVVHLTGLHVSSVHVVFKNLVAKEEDLQPQEELSVSPDENIEE